ncbi:glycoside hydrolase family protein [Photobacterium swingsii]|uniref:glycoside hydrolase family protein n=1 Tax=Photobacterium swingsii TaxID=680026 RepID=UPI003D113AD3
MPNPINVLESILYKGRTLEIEGMHVWGASPIASPDGRIHVFFSAWDKNAPHAAWVISCKVYHAVADSVESPFEVTGCVFEGRGGKAWDSWSIHNPSVTCIDGKYYMVYMGTDGSSLSYDQADLSQHILEMQEKGEFKVPEDAANAPASFNNEIWGCYEKLVESKRVGIAVADSLDGVWTRLTPADRPTVDVGTMDAWDSVVVSNPALVKGVDGKIYLYYKSWDWQSWRECHGNRKYGVAIASSPTSIFEKYAGNPILDFEFLGHNAQLEDACVFVYQGAFHMIARDMGIKNNSRGVYMHSSDGIHWSEPETAYQSLAYYSNELSQGLEREGRFERPQVLMQNGEPTALFCALIGGQYGTSTSSIFTLKLKGTQ